MEETLLMVLFILEDVKYYLAYEVIFEERLKRYLVPTIGALVYLAVLFAFRDSSKAFLDVLVYLNALCVVFIVQKTSLLDRICKLFILLFILSCTDAFFEKMLDLFLKHHNNGIGWEALAESLLTLLVILILFFAKKKSNPSKRGWLYRNLEKLVMPIVVLMALEIVATIAGLDYADAYISNDRFKSLAAILCLFAYFGIGMLGVFVIYIRRMNKNMQKLVENERLLQDMQRQYYESLLEKEEDTRRYRHDIANHLLCINRLAEESHLAELREYLRNMLQELNEIQKNKYDVGNRIINVITNHYIKELTSMTKIVITGRIQVQLDEMKLCTIYANLLQNAVEELKRCEGEEVSTLEIHFEQGQQFCSISICNSLSEKSCKRTEELLLKSDKPDRKNHGLGLLNTQKAVASLNGTLNLTRKENCFLAIVILPL